MQQRPEHDLRDDGDPNALPLGEARARILAAVHAVPRGEVLPLASAIGRYARSAIDAPGDAPPFRASAMDGYALRFDDGGTHRRIDASSRAGHPSGDRLPAGTCHRILTGARVPDDADTVVQQEDVSLQGDRIEIREMPTRGLNVRAAGSAAPRGTRLVDAGDRLGSAALAVLAAHGVAGVEVAGRVRIGVLSTGDELVEPGQPLGPGQIHDANRILLRGLLHDPCLEFVELGIVADSSDALRERIDGATDIDVLMTSGGVSVGDADHVRTVIGDGGRVELWKIAMKPGRPLAFGRVARGCVWFGLPGNPVSVAVTTLFIARPALTVMAGGLAPAMPMPRTAILESDLVKRPGRVEFQRGLCRLDEQGVLHVSRVGAQDSHVLRSLQLGNCLIELPSASAGVAAGHEVSVYRYEGFATSPM